MSKLGALHPPQSPTVPATPSTPPPPDTITLQDFGPNSCPECGEDDGAHLFVCSLSDVPFAPAAASHPDITQPVTTTDALDALKYVAGPWANGGPALGEACRPAPDVAPPAPKPSQPPVSLFSLCRSRLSQIFKPKPPE